jgi:cyclase
MPPVSRRTFVQTSLATALLPTVGRRAWAQAPAPPPITATRLTDRVTSFFGGGGNVGLVTTADGLLMIDGGTANRAADIARAIAGVSPLMVQVLFNTHYHFDHTGSNDLLGPTGVRIIAHQNVARRVATTFNNEAMARTMEAVTSAGLPKDTFTTNGTLTFGPERLDYTHVPAAHTDGDAYVFLPNANVLHTGDLLWVNRYPVVDYSAGGSLAGMVAALDRLDRVGDARTQIIPGHGAPTATRDQLREMRDIWQAVNQRFEQFAAAGRSVDEVIAVAPTRDFDQRVGVRNAEPFVRQAYLGELTRRGMR